MSDLSKQIDRIGREIQRWIDFFRGKDKPSPEPGPTPPGPGPGPGPTPPTPPAPVPSNFCDPNKPFLGYGLVDGWHHLDPGPFTAAVADHGVQLAMFEIWDWLNPRKFEIWPDILVRFEKWIKAAEKKRLLVYVHLTQGNFGRGGGDNNSNHQTEIYAVARKFAEWMPKYPHVYVTPVAELGNCDASLKVDKALQSWCKANMPRRQLVNNYPAKPSNTDGMGFAAQHPASVSAAKKALPGWIVSDHGSFIKELNGGGSVAGGDCNYEVTVKCARDLRKAGRTFIYFDTNTVRKNYSANALRALRDARQ